MVKGGNTGELWDGEGWGHKGGVDGEEWGHRGEVRSPPPPPPPPVFSMMK